MTKRRFRGWGHALQIGIVVAAMITAGLVAAQTPEENSDEWEFFVSFPMVWLPDIGGAIDVDGDKIDVDTPIEDTLDKLEVGFIGEIYARKGPWTLALRTMYLGTRTDTRTEPVGLPGYPPLIGSHKITVESDLFTSDIIGGYGFNEYVSLYTGVRRSGLKLDVRFRESAEEPGKIDLPRKLSVADEELYDLIGGVILEYPFGAEQRWRAVVEADTMLAGDNDQDYQINAFFSRRLANDRHAVWFGYRYLRLVREFSDEGTTIETDFVQSGPTLGWTFVF